MRSLLAAVIIAPLILLAGAQASRHKPSYEVCRIATEPELWNKADHQVHINSNTGKGSLYLYGTFTITAAYMIECPSGVWCELRGPTKSTAPSEPFSYSSPLLQRTEGVSHIQCYTCSGTGGFKGKNSNDVIVGVALIGGGMAIKRISLPPWPATVTSSFSQIDIATAVIVSGPESVRCVFQNALGQFSGMFTKRTSFKSKMWSVVGMECSR